ncbi:MAG TPA: hypothetical protein VLX68_02585 [Chitinivibrionales bacterium]|nr:hypothetical protein [Chitinivibrionales bacterium]
MIVRHSMRRASAPVAAIVLTLALCLQASAGTAAKRGKASHAAPRAQVTAPAKDAGQLVSDLDSLFAKSKADFDKLASSVILKYPRTKPVNNMFWKALKAHQPWHSLFRTDKKGAVINEVIRIEGESKEKRSVATEAWFTQISKTMKEHLTIFKNEKTGRYYLVWAEPIVAKVKKVDTFQGAVVANIDLWDCFDRYADKSTSPFKVHILDRVVLFEHLWRDTIKSSESHLTVPGLDKITVRYPRPATEAASAQAVDSAALVQAQQDSLKAKTARDLAASMAAKAEAAKKAKAHNTILLTVIIIIAVLIIILLVIMVARGRKRPEDAGPEGGDRFGNL